MSDLGESILRGALEALAFAKGEADSKAYGVHIPDEINVKRIRENLNMTQKDFAIHFGFSLRTVQVLEQGRVVPSGGTRAFLVVIDREPEAVKRALIVPPSHGYLAQPTL
jgi:putative transcriptional regulator